LFPGARKEKHISTRTVQAIFEDAREKADIGKDKKSLGYVGREDMSEYIRKGYIRIADIMLILDDMRIADIPKLDEMLTSGHFRKII